MRYLICWIILLLSSPTLAAKDAIPEMPKSIPESRSSTTAGNLSHISATLRKNGFVYCINGNLNTFNPQMAISGLTVDTLAAQIYNRLLGVDPLTYRLVPELATQWEVRDNGATYRFYLRHNVAFQSTDWFTPSRTMNADDVVFSFRRVLDKTHYYHYVNGGHYPYFDSLQFDNTVQDIRKIDNYTVEFRLHTPDASFIWHLATYYAPILSQEYAKKLDHINRQEQIDWKPVGTGSFMLEDYQSEQFIRLVRHDKYWRGKPSMEQVVVDTGAGGTGRISKLLTGECDVLAYPDANQWNILHDDPNLRQTLRSGMNIAYLAFNTSKPPLDKLEVRQAIAYAINNQRLMKSIYYGTAETAASILPRASWAYDNRAEITEYNPEKSRKILNELGLNGLELTLWVPTSSQSYNPSPLKMAQLIQADLAQVGIKMSIRPVEGRFQERKLMDKTHDMTLAGWSTNSNDPDSFFRPLLSCAAIASQTNLSRWCNSAFDDAIHQALLNQQLASRIKNYHVAQEILAQQLPVLPLAYSMRLQISRYNIKGLVLSPFGNSSFAGVYREQDMPAPAENKKESK
ncbi:peptide ABC transporter substrate-binding protein SapA [Xenorhabdus nematophila]|uniref:ABC transporter substrate-binding protein SapA n=1 Tax=Xenorhabdus nematophila TaxID=628 RepID=UPI000327597A|nr:ABC transporter substrate-binding protein SapA [Xenorhabdus nematophila]CEF29716.1 peptide transport protein (ABC superfamily, peri_bind) [Xenorhabdus nematophila str. Websteri]AYA40010.1 peptide ABC transporter substrate-binding protein SapA [Xenorhabdus nematophila]KHD28232.1 ABC transporter substrate-binding protein [Xenorhabdus nematophila]MBA0018650.1 peptide ABC transporter substrate-binding protein SapA [Xenorhabdus nematophila]MCB4426349.1 peptide ABC transporter substrate-binding p